MTADMTVTYTSTLPAMEKKLNTLLERIVAKTAHDIVATAQGLVPVDTGALKNSIHAVTAKGLTQYATAAAKAGKKRKDAAMFPEVRPSDKYEAVVAVGMEYGIYVEYGSAHVRKTTRMSTRKAGATVMRIRDRKYATAVPARPFMRPAVQARTDPFNQAVTEVIRLAALG